MTTNPITLLQDKLHHDQDRHAALLSHSRKLTRKLGRIRDELNDLDTTISATRGLLTLADNATRQPKPATNTKPATTPAAGKPTKGTRK